MKKIKFDDEIQYEINARSFDDFDAVLDPQHDSAHDAFCLGYQLGQLNKKCYIIETEDQLCFMLGNKKSILKRIKKYLETTD